MTEEELSLFIPGTHLEPNRGTAKTEGGAYLVFQEALEGEVQLHFPIRK